jgi:hypothetical protein
METGKTYMFSHKFNIEDESWEFTIFKCIGSRIELTVGNTLYKCELLLTNQRNKKPIFEAGAGSKFEKDSIEIHKNPRKVITVLFENYHEFE